MEGIGLKGPTQKIVRSRQHRYLELTIFYRTTVMQRPKRLFGLEAFCIADAKAAMAQRRLT
jgi:hypothetical protein